MARQFPSQYDCDNMDKDDMIMIKSKNVLYKWYRKNFMKDKIILKLNPNQNNLEVNEAYQEDCTLFTGAEINCIKEYKQEIPCLLSETFFGQEFLTSDPIKYMQIGLNNIVIKFSFTNKRNTSFSISFFYFIKIYSTSHSHILKIYMSNF